MEKFSSEDGVWRTVGGRRIFIKDGQSLADAMKESGKFKNKKSEVKSEIDADDVKKLDEEYDKAHGVYKKEEQKEKEIAKKEHRDAIEKENKERLQKLENQLETKSNKESNEDKEKEEWNSKVRANERLNAKNKNYELSLNDRDAKDVLKQLNDEGSDFTFDDDVKIEDGKIKTTVGVYMPDERGYVERDLEIPVSENETYDSLEEKIRDWQDRHNTPDSFEDEDFKKSTNETMNNVIREKANKKSSYKEDLPQKTEIKTQGTSNRKEVSENIQAHILEYYDSPEDFVEQMDAMSHLPNNWKRGEELAKGGNYLIYNGDMSDFLDELKINPKGKNFSEDKAFDMYTSLVGRESAKLYDRLQRNAYNKYKKEHPLSNMSFEDFKDKKK